MRNNFSGFSQIGHIVHVNLREELLLYKKVIGKILLDKVASCKYVFLFHSVLKIRNADL